MTSRATGDIERERLPLGRNAIPATGRLQVRKKPRILVVDDEPSFTRLVKLVLEATGHYEVLEENDGKRTIEVARAFGPDLVLLDIIMPDIGGAEIAAKFREQVDLRRVPIVFLTAIVSRKESKGDSVSIGGHCFVPKPVGAEELINVIEQQLRC